jgi:hypothetical protein
MASISVALKSSMEMVSSPTHTLCKNQHWFLSGLAYIGNSAPPWLSVASNITFTTYGEATTTPWIVTSNTTAFSGNPKLYIITTSGSFSQVGFLPANDTAAGGETISGLTFYGTNVAYAASDSDYQMQFWATSTNTTGVWQLMWNANGKLESNSVPVVLKSTPPVTPTVWDGKEWLVNV